MDVVQGRNARAENGWATVRGVNGGQCSPWAASRLRKGSVDAVRPRGGSGGGRGI